MHGYPDLLPPGCRLPPPPHDLMYGGHHPPLPPPPDMLAGPPGGGPLDLVDPPTDDWVRSGEGPPPPPAPLNLFLPHPRAAGGPPDGPSESEFTYLDTSDDSGRHTGPEPSSP